MSAARTFCRIQSKSGSPGKKAADERNNTDLTLASLIRIPRSTKAGSSLRGMSVRTIFLPAAADTGAYALPPIEVVGTIRPDAGPTVGSGVPARVTILGAEDVDAYEPRVFSDAVRQVAGISTYDDLGSPYKLNMSSRGFYSSPVVGLPQGVADFARRELRFQDGQRCELSEREVELLRYLAANAERAVTRDELLANVWRITPDGLPTRTIDMHVARLREKLRDDSADPQVLLTVRGKGYMFCGAAQQTAAGEARNPKSEIRNKHQ